MGASSRLAAPSLPDFLQETSGKLSATRLKKMNAPQGNFREIICMGKF
jgi:hypothetical protein